MWGLDREAARRRLLRALHEYVLEGVNHNLAFHRWLASHPEFVAGNLSTRFLEEHFDAACLAPGPEAAEIALFAAALHEREERQRIAVAAPNGAGARSSWKWPERRRTSARVRR